MKIGLIAMSGIRAYNEELTKLGLTLPGFVERNKIIASLPSLGLLTLAGMTTSEFDIEYLEIADIRQMKELPNSFDIAAISSYTAQINEAYELSALYRKKGIKTILGGPHVSCLPDEAKEYCDCVVIGEGEAVWNKALADFKNNKLKPFYGSREGKDFDINNAPMPRFDLLLPEKYNRLTIQTSRGCPHHCEFCAASRLITDKYKQKPKEKVLNEIREIKKIWKHPFIEFADDNTFVNKKYWKNLLPDLIKENIRWFTETDISAANDVELLKLMRESGCAQVLIGLESPKENGLNGLELRNNWKYRQLDKYKRAVSLIQSHGITVNGCFILGLDGHSPEIFEDVFTFVKETGLYEVQITVLTPFHGTALYQRFLKEGRLIKKCDWKKCTLFDVIYHPKNMTIEELESGFRDLASRLYSAEFTKFRRDNFKKLLRESVKAKG